MDSDTKDNHSGPDSKSQHSAGSTSVEIPAMVGFLRSGKRQFQSLTDNDAWELVELLRGRKLVAWV